MNLFTTSSSVPNIPVFTKSRPCCRSRDWTNSLIRPVMPSTLSPITLPIPDIIGASGCRNPSIPLANPIAVSATNFKGLKPFSIPSPTFSKVSDPAMTSLRLTKKSPKVPVTSSTTLPNGAKYPMAFKITLPIAVNIILPMSSTANSPLKVRFKFSEFFSLRTNFDVKFSIDSPIDLNLSRVIAGKISRKASPIGFGIDIKALNMLIMESIYGAKSSFVKLSLKLVNAAVALPAIRVTTFSNNGKYGFNAL